MRRRRFKSARLQLAYDRHLNTGDPHSGQGVSGKAFRRGYAGMRNLWPRGSLGYVAWAAGKDRRTADMISAVPVPEAGDRRVGVVDLASRRAVRGELVG